VALFRRSWLCSWAWVIELTWGNAGHHWGFAWGGSCRLLDLWNPLPFGWSIMQQITMGMGAKR